MANCRTGIESRRLKAELDHIAGVLEAELENQMADFDPEDFKRMERDSENARKKTGK